MNRAFDVLAAIVTVAMIMVLVRPGSQGPSLVDALGSSFASVLGVATGSAYPTSAGGATYAGTSWASQG